MNIFWFEMKSYRKSTIIWSITLILIFLFFMSVYPSFTNNMEETKKLIQAYSPQILSAFGLNLDTFFSVLGYYSFVFIYILFCGAIQATNIGVSIISKESRNKTADFILTKPLPRTKVLTSKLLAVAASLVITNLVYNIVTFISAGFFTSAQYSKKAFFMLSLSLLFVQIIFAAVGVLLAVLNRKIKSVVSVSLIVVFTFFLISMISSIIQEDALNYLTPFRYFEPYYIMGHTAYKTSFLIISIVLVAVLTVSSFVIYSKKDIHAV